MNIAGKNKSISKGELCQYFDYQCTSKLYYKKLEELILNDAELVKKLSWSEEDKKEKYAAQHFFQYPQSKIIIEHFDIKTEAV